MRSARQGVGPIYILFMPLLILAVQSFKCAASALKAFPPPLRRRCHSTARSISLPISSRNAAGASGVGTRWRKAVSVAANDASTSAKESDGKLSTDTSLSTMTSEEFRPFRVTNIQQVSHNTRLIDIALSNRNEWPGFVTSCLVMLRCKSADGSFVARPYTPVSKCNQRGSFQLLVKSYPQGVVSKYVGTLNVGDTVDVKGPLFKLKYTPNLRRQIGMIAGGTGIAPMLQVIKEILGNPMDKSNITLLFGNHEEGDILLRSELDALAAKHESQLTVHYVVSKPTQSWTGLKGIINEDMVRRLIPRPSPDVLVYVCGPPAMMEAVSGPKGANFTQGPVLGMLQRTGYTETMVYKF